MGKETRDTYSLGQRFTEESRLDECAPFRNEAECAPHTIHVILSHFSLKPNIFYGHCPNGFISSSLLIDI